MTSTPSLVLKFDTKDLELTLYESMESVRRRISTYEVEQEEDAEMARSYLRLIGLGAELSFGSKGLSTVFLHLSEGEGNCGVFTGATDLLDKKTIELADENMFANSLEAQGFSAPNRTYPYAIDRLNSDIRVRLEKRHGQNLIVIDDGSLIR